MCTCINYFSSVHSLTPPSSTNTPPLPQMPRSHYPTMLSMMKVKHPDVLNLIIDLVSTYVRTYTPTYA